MCNTRIMVALGAENEVKELISIIEYLNSVELLNTTLSLKEYDRFFS